MQHSLDDIEDAIRHSWGSDSCYQRSLWDAERPWRGQAATTALVLLDFLGGDLLEARVSRDGLTVEHHYWVRLPSGLEVDLTRDQFDDDLAIGEPEVRHRPPRLKPGPRKQYRALLERVNAHLNARDGG